MNLDELQARLAQVREGPGDDHQASLALDLLLADLSDDEIGACVSELALAKEAPAPLLAEGLIKRTRAALPVGPGPAVLSFGPYRVVREIARGGMGVVYEVEHTESARRYALKTLPLLPSGEAHGRARREADLLARLDHPRVVTIHAASLDPPHPYLVQDLLTGGSLDERLRRDGRLQVSEALDVAYALGEGLRHAHDLSVVHRDLKPSNVLFDEEGEARLVDFGLARSLRDGTERLTQTGAVLGTPAFIAPEQVTGAGKSEGRQTDVYGLGILLHTMLAGAPPFAVDPKLGEASLFVLLRAVIHQLPASLSTLRPEVPSGVARLVLATLEKDPAARPSLDEVMAALDALRAGRASTLPRRPGRPGWLVPGLVAAALLLAVGANGLRARAERTDGAARVAEVLSWERQSLTPSGYGVTHPLDLQAMRPEIERRLGAVASLALSPDDALRADALSARLQAHLRLARHRRGEAVDVPKTTAARAPDQLVVDALILFERGAPADALRRVERALEDGRNETAETLRLAIHAARGPAALARARDALHPEPPTGRGGQLVLDALAPYLREALEGLPRSGDLSELRAIDEAVRWVGAASAGGLADVKTEALDASADDWQARLARAEPARLRLAVAPLIDAALLAPRAEAGPRLKAALRAALRSHADSARADIPRGSDGPELSVLACDGLVGLAFGPEAALERERVYRLGETLSLLPTYGALPVLAYLRGVGVTPQKLQRLAAGVDRASLHEVLSRWPESDAAIVVEAIRRERSPIPPERGSTSLSAVFALDAVPGVRRALARTARSDLHPRSRSAAHLLVATRLALKVQHDAGTREEDGPAIDAHWKIAFADEANRTPFLLYQGYVALAQARATLENDHHGVKTWTAAVAAFGGPDGQAEPPERTHARCDLALALLSARQPERARAVAREALARSTERVGELHARAALSRILRVLGRGDDAWEVARPARGSVENYNLLVETLDLLWARGHADEARALVDEGLRRWPAARQLLDRRDRYADAPPSSQ